MRCEECDTPILHSGLSCANCDLAAHVDCADGWRRDAEGNYFCPSCGWPPIPAHMRPAPLASGGGR